MRWLAAVTVAAAVSLMPALGCHREGPAEETGRKVDEAIDKLKNPDEGPLEKSGRKIDEAVDDLRE